MSRVILITGANNGIGLELTRSLLGFGDRVAALDLAINNVTTLSPRSNLLPIICDVTDSQRVEEAVAQVVGTWDSLDILVNNACLALFKLFIDRTPDELRSEFEVNYFGYLNLIRAVLPVMQKQGHGIVHNVSSGVGFTGMPGMTGYTSTKGAIEALTRSLSLELAADHITVNVMHPPLSRTNSASGFGIPLEMMADPAAVGRKMARKIGSTRPTITPDFSTSLGLWANRHFPVAMGHLLNSLSQRARQQVPAHPE